ncbi:hypothetical protein KJ742_06330 [Patescibacteria group bacterium]|nr:hypothetical protein [Patescibacteria group bacterium]MBU1683528.1 hypothetical protein [Patescibacteria group bacterium]MBU1935020.1 hypothetical protein [Patescibacteria group bacterium]
MPSSKKPDDGRHEGRPELENRTDVLTESDLTDNDRLIIKLITVDIIRRRIASRFTSYVGAVDDLGGLQELSKSVEGASTSRIDMAVKGVKGMRSKGREVDELANEALRQTAIQLGIDEDRFVLLRDYAYDQVDDI